MIFELLVATRYLRAKRKQAVISLITLIAILGVAAGVAALIVAMAVSEGQREDILNRLLVAQAHITVTRPRVGIPDYIEVTKQIEQIDGVVAAAPHSEMEMGIRSRQLAGVLVKGIIPELEGRVSAIPQSVIAGKFSDLSGNSVVIGKELAQNLGVGVGESLSLISPDMSAGALGAEPKELVVKIAAIYSIGLYEYDSSLVYVPFEQAAYLVGAGPVATNIEVKVRDIDHSIEIGRAIQEKLGPEYHAEDWSVSNKRIFQALKLERLGMTIAIGLIVFVAALNIVATLTMMVLEKTRDIATLMAMGATLSQIRRIFIVQGVIIGVIGTAIGLVLGHAISYLADTYRLISLDPEVYSISFLPFRAVLSDSLLIAVAAIAISFLATLYPAAAAARLQPVEALRYE